MAAATEGHDSVVSMLLDAKAAVGHTDNVWDDCGQILCRTLDIYIARLYMHGVHLGLKRLIWSASVRMRFEFDHLIPAC